MWVGWVGSVEVTYISSWVAPASLRLPERTSHHKYTCNNIAHVCSLSTDLFKRSPAIKFRKKRICLPAGQRVLLALVYRPDRLVHPSQKHLVPPLVRHRRSVTGGPGSLKCFQLTSPLLYSTFHTNMQPKAPAHSEIKNTDKLKMTTMKQYCC